VTFLLILTAAAATYQAMALYAALRRLRLAELAPAVLPPISILKPVCGLDPGFHEAIRSHLTQDYPEYEILFGAADPADPALVEVRRLMSEFPDRPVRIIHGFTAAPNRKAGVLAGLARAARHPLLVVNDSDIHVPRDYLRRIVAPLEDPSVGVVTCLYRACSAHWPGRWEAIGIAADFAPSVLVAPYAGVREFGLGATLAFRAPDLEAIGGFEALAEYLADDYQLASRIVRLGRKAVLAKVTVETRLAGRAWGEIWRRQVRWARTIRLTRPGGYAGLPLANASLWSLAAAAAGLWWAALPLLALRIAAGVTVGWRILGSRDVRRHFYLIPLRDLWGAAVWAAGLFGGTVEWRGSRLHLTRDGRIAGSQPA